MTWVSFDGRLEGIGRYELENEGFHGQFASRKEAVRWVVQNQHSNVKFDENRTTSDEENGDD